MTVQSWVWVGFRGTGKTRLHGGLETSSLPSSRVEGTRPVTIIFRHVNGVWTYPVRTSTGNQHRTGRPSSSPLWRQGLTIPPLHGPRPYCRGGGIPTPVRGTPRRVVRENLWKEETKVQGVGTSTCPQPPRSLWSRVRSGFGPTPTTEAHD